MIIFMSFYGLGDCFLHSEEIEYKILVKVWWFDAEQDLLGFTVNMLISLVGWKLKGNQLWAMVLNLFIYFYMSDAKSSKETLKECFEQL